MSLRTALLRPPLRRIASRRVCTATGSAQTSPSKGPKLPVGNDPAAFHDQQHALADNDRWRLISMVFALPVTGFFIINLMNEHEHVEPPPDYPYLKMANRVPRFPWGDDDLIGTSYERRAKQHASDHSDEH